MYRNGSATQYKQRCHSCFAIHEEWMQNRTVEEIYGTTLICTLCKKEKSTAEFYKNGNGNFLHKRCKPCFDSQRKSMYASTRERKLRCLEAYGGACVCCEISEEIFLTFDHINDDGAQHRRKIRSGYSFYKWLIDNDFPDSIQILCFNCNWAKSRGGCPHRRD